MKLTIIGMKRIKGDKSKAGNPFDMPRLFAQVPIESVSNDKVTIIGKGFEIAEIPYELEAEEAFLKLTYPLLVDLKMDSRPRFGKFESVCVGHEPLTAAQVAVHTAQPKAA